MTANQDLFNAAIRQQVAVRRFTQRQVRAMLSLLERADADLASQLRRRIARGLRAGFTQERLTELLRYTRTQRTALMATLQGDITGSLQRLSAQQAAGELEALSQAIPIDLALASVPVDRLHALVSTRPFQGHHLDKWWGELARRDQLRLNATLRQGILQQQTLDDIVRSVIGTRAANYTDGILSLTRRNAEAVTRTAINHVSNTAREAVWQANKDIILGLRWTSTLDGRTSAVCRARDGDMVPIDDTPLPPGIQLLEPPGARPPAHINCRSVMVAVLDPEGVVGERPFVRDTRTRRKREIDFRKDARARAGDEQWRRWSEAERRRAIADVRRQWAQENIGTVPAKTTYEEWIKDQPQSIQNAILGKGKAELLRSGKLTLADFVDVGGRERTLDELSKLVKMRTRTASKVLEDVQLQADRGVREAGIKRGESIEYLSAVDMDTGELVVKLHTSNEASFVSFTDEQMAIFTDPTRRLYLTHNHPSSRSFSKQDIMMLSQAKGMETIVAVGHNGTRFMATLPGETSIRKLYDMVDQAMRGYFQLAITEGNLSVDTASALHHHAVMEVLNRSGLLKYTVEASDDFRSLLDDYNDFLEEIYKEILD